MPGHKLTSRRLSFAVSLAALAVSACNQPASSNQQNSAGSGQPVSAPPIAALPLATAAPVAAQPAPPASALPLPARALNFTGGARENRYRYTERAYAMSSAFGDTPPDYTVDYQGTRPWIWRSNNGGYRVVERIPDGQRDYYYQPGDTQPFYVSDPDAGYAYDRGQLVGVYGADGIPVNDVYAAQRADAAARYLYRAQELYRAAQYEQRQAAYAADWQARRDAVIAQRRSWEAARARDADWQAWHDAHAADERNTWNDEQNRRMAYAAAIGVSVGAAAVALTRHHDGRPPDGGGPAYNRVPNMAEPPRFENGSSFGHPANNQQLNRASAYSNQSPQPHSVPPTQAIARREPVAPVHPVTDVANVQYRHDRDVQFQARRAHQQQIAAAQSAAENGVRTQQAANAQRQAQAARQRQQIIRERAAATARAASTQAMAAQASRRKANAEQQQQMQQQQASRRAEQNAQQQLQAARQRQQIIGERAAAAAPVTSTQAMAAQASLRKVNAERQQQSQRQQASLLAEQKAQQRAQAARQRQQVIGERAAAAARVASTQAMAAQALLRKANAERQQQMQQQQVSRMAEQDAKRARQRTEVERTAARTQIALAHQQQAAAHAQLAVVHQQQQAAHAAAAHHSAPAPREQISPRPHPKHAAN
ncbi:MAG: hypothetical protein JWL66_104 [Sphingomonadales bacterium]|nr:hypothetical protein [Sphingomonadales bacterium]